MSKGRPKGKTEYDPEKHCGGKNGAGEPCKKPRQWGVSPERKEANAARGNFKCKLHGGNSTGAKTKEGKQRSRTAPMKHGFYSTVLTGKTKVDFDAAQEHPPSTLLLEGFNFAHAKLRAILAGENDARFSREARWILEAAQVGLDSEELSQEFVNDLRLKLLNLDLSRILELFQRSGSLATQAMQVDQMGVLSQRASILEKFLIQVAKTATERHIRMAVIETISLLKLEAGLPLEKLDELLQAGMPEQRLEPEDDE